MKKTALFLACCLFSMFSFGQQQKEVIATIDGEPVYTDEFEHMFTKNQDLLQERNKQSVTAYMDMFVDYKLKLIEAHEQGLDTLTQLQREFNLYKNQLAEKYLKENEVTDQLLKEAYERLQEERNVSHILVMLKDNDTPADTLKAYQKIQEARKKIIKGTDFDRVAKQYSEDPSVRQNNGNVGWFSAFKMVYPFENAAYNTPKGEISPVFKTRFGYHILKVNDVRKNEGSIRVAHIFLSDKKGDSLQHQTEIQELYKKLNDGAAFADLAKQFSDDEHSAANGGELNPFTRATMQSQVFEDKAFALREPGDYTKAFKSEFGWHIVKLIEKLPLQDFEAEKQRLALKVKRDSRSQLINENLIQDIRQQYEVSEKDEALSFFETYFQQPEKERKSLPDRVLIQVNDSVKTYADFKEFVYNKTSSAFTGIPFLRVQNYLNEFKDKFLRSYHKANLAHVNQAYAAVIQEYKNGLLLFDLMEKNVWNKAKEDTLALQAYYEEHQTDYQVPTQYEAIIYTGDQKKQLKKLRRALRKDKSVAETKKQVSGLLENEGVFSTDASTLPKNFKGKKGISKVYENNGVFLVVDVKKRIPAHLKSFEEAQGKVIADYQEQVEKEWMASLRKKHTVEINPSVVKKMEQKFE